MKKKIAFVVVRYGLDVNGGAELHCRMLAERLVANYQVEVLTTCIHSYSNPTNDYPEGEETINGVTVRRFKTDPVHIKRKFPLCNSRIIRDIRRLLYRLSLLKPIANYLPIWNIQKKDELRIFRKNLFYSSSLFSYIQSHKNDYDVFIPLTIDYPETYYTALYAPEKTLVIPTMHEHKNAFRPILTEVFTRVAYIGFNMESEMKLAENIFGSAMSPHGVISVGINIASKADWEETQTKYRLPEEYLLYVGRIDPGKLDNIFNYFLTDKAKYKQSKLKLVLVGSKFFDAAQHPDIIYTGFVNDNEKITIIQHAKIVLNPSRYESLSLILLEALSLGKAMMANGKCNVMKEHEEKSNHAIIIYRNKKDFIKQLYTLDFNNALRKEMEGKGISYVQQNYNWSLIIQRLNQQIEYINNTKQKSGKS